MTVKKIFQGKSATPSKYASGGVGGRPSGLGPYTSNRPPSGAGRVSFGGNAMSRPIRGGKAKRY